MFFKDNPAGPGGARSEQLNEALLSGPEHTGHSIGRNDQEAHPSVLSHEPMLEGGSSGSMKQSRKSSTKYVPDDMMEKFQDTFDDDKFDQRAATIFEPRQFSQRVQAFR